MEGPAYMFGSCLLSWLTHSQGAWDYHLLVNTRATRSLVFNLFGVKYRVWESDANWELSPKKKHTKEAHTQSFAFKFGEFTNSQSPSWTSRLQWPFFCLILLFLILTNKIFWPLQVFSKCLLNSTDPWTSWAAVFLALWVASGEALNDARHSPAMKSINLKHRSACESQPASHFTSSLPLISELIAFTSHLHGTFNPKAPNLNTVLKSQLRAFTNKAAGRLPKSIPRIHILHTHLCSFWSWVGAWNPFDF